MILRRGQDGEVDNSIGGEHRSPPLALPRGLECRSCGYDVSALEAPMTEARCPECGLEVARSLQAWRRSGEVTLSQLRALRLAAIMSGMAMLLLVLWFLTRCAVDLWIPVLRNHTVGWVLLTGITIAGVVLLFAGWLRKGASEVAFSERRLMHARLSLAVIVLTAAFPWLLALLPNDWARTIWQARLLAESRSLVLGGFFIITGLVLGKAAIRTSQRCTEGRLDHAARRARAYCIALGIGVVVRAIGMSHLGSNWDDMEAYRIAMIFDGLLGVLLIVVVFLGIRLMLDLAAALRPLASEKWLARPTL